MVAHPSSLHRRIVTRLGLRWGVAQRAERGPERGPERAVRGLGRGAARARCALLALWLLSACSVDGPRFLDVQLAQNGAHPFGPHRITALVAGGAQPVRVRARFAVDDPGRLAGPCGDALAPGRLRGVDPEPGADAGTPPTTPEGAVVGECAEVEGQRAGEVFTVDLSAAPFAPGVVVHYRLEAIDAAGNRQRWPGSDESARFVVAPSGRAPALLALAPTRGAAGGGTTVLLRGEGFGRGTRVYFGEARASAVQVESPHLLEVEAPAGAPGVADVWVERDGRRTRLEGAWRWIGPPTLDRVDPARGPASAEVPVVLTGRDLTDAVALVVTDPAVEGATSVQRVEVVVGDATWVSARVPPGPPGTARLQVVDAFQQISNIVDFERWPAPTLDAIDPVSGPDFGGTVVRVTGADLRAPGAAWFGDRAAVAVRVAADGRSATVRTPRAPAGAVPVVWYNPDGQSATAPQPFRFVGAPQVEAADPPEVSRCGGGVTRLIGRNFDPEMEVRFNDVPGEVLEVNADGTEALVRAPAGTPGPARITVTNPDGRSTSADDLVVFGVQPAIRSVTPARVPIWGGSGVRIDAADLDAEVAVFFGELPAEQVRLVPGPDGCAVEIFAVEPPHPAGFVDLRVENRVNPGAAVLPRGVEYVAPTLEPPDGLTPGYTNVELRGVDLRAGLEVRIGGVAPRRLVQLDETRWALVTPAGPRGPVALTVRTVSGRGAELPGAFVYRQFVDGTAASGLRPVGDCNDVSVADIDGDGQLDLVTANGGLGGVGRLNQPVGLHFGRPGGTFDTRTLGPEGNGMNARLGDLDGDGRLDLLVANLSSPTNTFWRNLGAGNFGVVADFPAVGPSYDADFVDIDGDGDLDVFLLQTGDPDDNLRQGPEQLWINDGAGRLVQRSEGVDFDPRDVHDHDFAHGDLNGDGLPDLVIVVDNLSEGFAGASNRLLINRGGGRLERVDSPFDRYPGDWLHVELADVDGDGDLDVLLPQDYIEGFSRVGTPPLALYLNDGAGRFEEAHERIVGLPPLPAFEAVAVDLDDDGDLDILVAVFGYLFVDGSVEPFESAVLLNDGTGTFFEASSAFEQNLRLATTDFGVGDFNGDGQIDLFECTHRAESRVWFQR